MRYLNKNTAYSKPPARFENANPKDIPAPIKAVIDGIREHRKGVLLYGGVGTGKTHILWSIWIHCQKERIPMAIVNSADLYDALKDDFNHKDNYNFNEIVNFKGILAIDDLGAEKPSEWVTETFYRIINRRYERKAPVAATSNYDLKELATRLHERTSSRLKEMTEQFKLDGKDKRMQK